jgi:murein DD-endopeptidase MepM/ murein hydrolase activator NlpD
VRRLALVSLLLVLAQLPWAAQAQTSSERAQLEEARARIERIEQELEGAREAAADADTALAEADARLADVEDAVNDAAAAIERQETAVARSGERLQELTDQASRVEEAFARRAARLYKSGGAFGMDIVLASGDIEGALQRSAYVRVVTAADRASLERVSSARTAVVAQRERWDAEREQLEEMYELQTDLLARAEDLRSSRLVLATEAADRVEELEAASDDLVDDVDRIERLIAERKITPVSSSLPSTSGYIWPRCDRVTSSFGRRWGRMHEGIDLAGRIGEPIAAAKAGVVIGAGWHGGYGRLVLIDHGDGVVTAYAHQSRILVEVGQRVDRGERIGDVGNTGRSTGPHLHFETRVNGAAVDPRRFLPSSC